MASMRSRPFTSIHQAPLMNKTFDQLSWTIEINEIGIVQCVIRDFTIRSTLNQEGQGGLQENRTCAVTTNLLSRGSQAWFMLCCYLLDVVFLAKVQHTHRILGPM